MVKVNIQTDHSWLITVKKTIINGLIFFGPSLLAFLANVPVEYAGIAGLLTYVLKDFLKHRNIK